MGPFLISETTGPILKIQAAFHNSGKVIENQNFITLGLDANNTYGKNKTKLLNGPGWHTGSSEKFIMQIVN